MLENYRILAESFLQRLAQAHYRHRVEADSVPDLESIYADHSDLYRPEAIEEIKRKMAEIPEYFSKQRKALRKLHSFALSQHLKASTLHLDKEIARHMATATLVWEGDNLLLAKGLSRLSCESDRDQRIALYRAMRSKRADIRSAMLLRIRRLAAAAQGLGYPDLLGLFNQISLVNHPAICLAARKFLEETRSFYESHLTYVIRGDLHLERTDIHPSDLIYLQRMSAYAQFFPAPKRMAVYGEMLDRLGIDLSRLKNLRVEENAKGPDDPGAECFAIRVPGEVVLLLGPIGGRGAYVQLLREGARCQLYSWTGASADIENRACGDRALGETYADLFASLIEEPLWLLDRLGISHSEGLLARQRLVRLMEVRREAALVLLAAEWIASPGWGEEFLAARHREIMNDALLCRFDESDWLMDMDALFEAADLFQASILAASFQEYMRLRYARSWYLEEQAGRLLKELWETGELYSAEELAREVGFHAAAGIDLLKSSLCGQMSHGKY